MKNNKPNKKNCDTNNNSENDSTEIENKKANKHENPKEADPNNNTNNKATTTSTKTKGGLQIKTVVLMKRKRPHKFKCEYCSHVTDSQKQLNTHHVANHGKVKCAVLSWVD